MEQYYNALRPLYRQLKDIQVQADKILHENQSGESIEFFAKYSSELKSYIESHMMMEGIKAYVKEIPDIHYHQIEIPIWEYLLFPMWWIDLYRDYTLRNKCLEEISTARSKYATIEVLIKENSGEL